MTRPALFCIAAATLMLELLLTRVFDVILTPNLAYMVIACALFSFGLAGVYVTLRPPKDAAHLPALCALFGLASLALLPILNWLPFDYEQLGARPLVQVVSFAAMYLALVVPFFLSGLVFTLLFSANARAIQSLYGWDLAGAAAGCAAMVPLLGPIGPGGILFVVGACGLLAGGLLAPDRRWFGAAAVAAAALVAVPALRSPAYFEFVEHLAKRGVKEARLDGRIEFSRWDPISKIDVIEQTLVDPATGAPRANSVRKHIAYDGGTQSSHVFPFDGDYARLRGVIEQATEPLDSHFWHRGVLASHFAKRDSGQRVLVIGSAGGQETKAALMYGAAAVDGVEMVRTVVDLVTGPVCRLRRPRLPRPPRAPLRDGRPELPPGHPGHLRHHPDSQQSHELERGRRHRRHVAQLPADRRRLPRLLHAPVGRRRPAHQPFRVRSHDHHRGAGLGSAWTQRFPAPRRRPRHGDRTGLAAHVPRPHAAVDRGTGRRPADALRDAHRGRIRLGVAAGSDPSRAQLPASGRFQRRALRRAAGAGREPRASDHRQPAVLQLPAPAHGTDRRRVGRRSPIRRRPTRSTRSSRRDLVPMDVVHLIVTGGLSLVFAGVFLVLPLLRSRMRRATAAVKSLTVLYFACLGAGFILIELVFIQVFMKLVGYPVYTYVLVIATLLLGAGLGSAASEGLGISPRARWTWPFAAVIAYGLVFTAIYPAVFERYLSSPDAVRMLVSAALIAPLGFALGMPFPLGILLAQRDSPEAVAWGWGLNGLFTVIGSLGSVLLGIAIGFQATILVAIGLYVLAFGAFAALRRVVHEPVSAAANDAAIAVPAPLAAQ